MTMLLVPTSPSVSICVVSRTVSRFQSCGAIPILWWRLGECSLLVFFYSLTLCFKMKINVDICIFTFIKSLMRRRRWLRITLFFFYLWFFKLWRFLLLNVTDFNRQRSTNLYTLAASIRVPDVGMRSCILMTEITRVMTLCEWKWFLCIILKKTTKKQKW